MNRHLGIALVVAALAFPASGAAAEQVTASERLLTVSGDGSVTASPDMAVVSVGVVSEDASASAALTTNSQSMTRVVDALKGEGIAARDLQTSGFAIEQVMSEPPPNYNQSTPFRPQIVGYRVRNTLTVRIRDLTRLGAILDQVVTLGANSVSGPTFAVADSQPLDDEARQNAVRDALRKARLYAEAAGVALGPIQRIEESYSRPPQPMQAAMFRLDGGGSVPVEGGELQFEAQVSVSWQLAE